MNNLVEYQQLGLRFLSYVFPLEPLSLLHWDDYIYSDGWISKDFFV